MTLPTDVERLFQQFCRTRDPAVLGEVFDRCADDLFAVALHLAADRAAAEDLVQSTFLVAIERATTWQPQRALQPWLLGILHREAKVQRRRERRQVDEQRLAVRGEVAPPQAALDAEARREVAQALGGVPKPYREVVELHLVQALAPAAIAERLRRSPGAVRTQLWRGLERLRELLPKGLAVGLVVSLQAQAPLAAVRARVVAAAAKVVVPASLAVAGAALMKKLLVGVALLLVAGVSWWVLPRAQSPLVSASPPAAAPAIVAAAASADEVPETPVLAPRQDAAPVDPGNAVANEPPPVPSPVDLPVLVLDANGAPVPGAAVEVLAPSGPPESFDRNPARERTVLHELLTTDGRGRVTVRLPGPCLISARQREHGWSGDRILLPGQRVLPAELQLVLQPTGIVRGVVLLPDGQPAVGVEVRASTPHGEDVYSPVLPPVTTGADGRFEFEVRAGVEMQWDKYWVRALRGNERTVHQEVRALPGQAVEVALQFAGACSVRGQMLDENGSPVAGRVLLRGGSVDPLEVRTWRAKCDAGGAFEILLEVPGAFELVGGDDGSTAGPIRVELDPSRPHVAVTLRTRPFVAVTGRVVDERGDALAGRVVALDWVLQPAAPGVAVPTDQLLYELVGGISRPTTATDGSFRASVPHGWRGRALVAAVPGNRELWSRSEVFTAPANGVTVVMRAADAQGFVLAGRVVAAANGEPLAAATIERIERDGGSSGAMPVGRAAKGTFRVGPFPTGRRYFFTFEAEGFARAEIGPFDASVRTEDVVVQMVKCGTVRCRVLRGDGSAAVGVFVSLRRDVADPFGPHWQGETDRDGIIEFRDVEPRSFTVHASLLRGADDPATALVRVHPAQMSDVVITLSR